MQRLDRYNEVHLLPWVCYSRRHHLWSSVTSMHLDPQVLQLLLSLPFSKQVTNLLTSHPYTGEKSQYLCKGTTDFDEIWHADATLPSACTLRANKILRFQKSKMAEAAIWKIGKFQYLCSGWTSFEKIWHVDVLQSYRPPQHIKFYALKNHGGHAIWKI